MTTVSEIIIYPSQINLISHDSEHCLLRVLPRYKFRSVGDEVSNYIAAYTYIIYIVYSSYVHSGANGRSGDIR